MREKTLVIVIDYANGFVGSRHYEDEMIEPQNNTWLMNTLKADFSGITLDDVLIIKNDKIVEEIYVGVRNRHG